MSERGDFPQQVSGFLTLNLLTSIARLQRGCLGTVTSTSLPHVFKLAQSPLLQGPPLRATLDFFQVGCVVHLTTLPIINNRGIKTEKDNHKSFLSFEHQIFSRV